MSNTTGKQWGQILEKNQIIKEPLVSSFKTKREAT